jgi:preprotein translocase subunit SecD
MLYSSPLRKAIILGICFFALLFALPNALPAEWREAMGRVYLPSNTVNLGLDLQGGSSLLLEVGVHKVVIERLNGVEDSVRKGTARERYSLYWTAGYGRPCPRANLKCRSG